jgi:general secretion pathway protein H
MASIRKKTRGFTLIEILVVVIIIATILGIALLSMGLIGDDRELDTERKRLATLIEVAQDEAMFQGREFGLELMQSSYRFVEFDQFTFQWSEILGDELFRLRQLPEGMEFDLYVEDKRIVLDPNPKQFADPEKEDMSADIEDYEPHIFVFSSGESTAYEIRLRRDVNDQQLAMRGDILGQIEFVDEDE